MSIKIIQQYLQNNFLGKNAPQYLIENSRSLGNLPQNITYNGLLYTFTPQLNAFVNQYGHIISISQASAFAMGTHPAAELDIITVSTSPKNKPIVAEPLEPTFDTTVTQNLLKSNSALVTWNYDNPGKISGYNIYRASSPPQKIATINDSSIFFYEDDGLSSGVEYTYNTTAFIMGGQESAFSNNADFEVAPIPFPGPSGITAPSGLTASLITRTTLRLNWVDNSNNEQGFFIHRSLDGITYTMIQLSGAGTTFTNVKGLCADKPYYFKINAYAAGISSSFSNITNPTTLPFPPSTPTELLATNIDGTSVNLSWQDSANNETGFQVYYRQV